MKKRDKSNLSNIFLKTELMI